MLRNLKLAVACALVLGLFTIGPAVVLGWDEPPPPPDGGDCSPGYFKNHTDEWFGLGCCEPLGLDDAQCLEELQSRGPGSAIRRAAAAAALNVCTGCTED